MAASHTTAGRSTLNFLTFETAPLWDANTLPQSNGISKQSSLRIHQNHDRRLSKLELIEKYPHPHQHSPSTKRKSISALGCSSSSSGASSSGGLADTARARSKSIAISNTTNRNLKALSERVAKAFEFDDTSFLNACKFGELEDLEDLAKYKQYLTSQIINYQDATGTTGLAHLCWRGEHSMIQLALKFPDIDPDIEDNDGNTPLGIAAQGGHTHIVTLLLDKFTPHLIKVDPPNNFGYTPLMKASMQGRNKCIRVLLAAGANPLTRDCMGRNCVDLAIYCDQPSSADILRAWIASERKPFWVANLAVFQSRVSSLANSTSRWFKNIVNRKGKAMVRRGSSRKRKDGVIKLGGSSGTHKRAELYEIPHDDCPKEGINTLTRSSSKCGISPVYSHPCSPVGSPTALSPNGDLPNPNIPQICVIDCS